MFKKLFGKKIDEDRYWEIFNKLTYKPKPHNMQELYLKHGGEWKLTPVSETKGYDNLDWSEMPQDQIDLLKAQPEFNAEIFKAVTGLDTAKKHKIKIDGKEIEISEKSYSELKKSLNS